ncbi:hypothetical protein LYSHEL_19480 [Lysobacter helvus]|uniref:Uncharacterized protein n=2 Tax=Lysobacteraceae TaxID=32033 RepID=A0ABN6FVB6_9GAMM|nr:MULTISPECIES: hypothetical protein [Lysobacter]BCT92925.1 hypothetical protein LYSCAS_19490 [Lysobacter caseinilyticus]BCT96077.1 hypothetical protein LYSHEL_19480 [Lysobacter helvus]
MPASDLLIAITQLGVALAGFSGLIAAIRTASPEGWHPRDIWSLSWMLGASIGALVLGLLPAWLALFDWTTLRVYRVASVVAFAYISVLGGVMAWRGRRLTLRGFPPRVKFFPSAIFALLGVSAIATGAGAAGSLQASIVPAYVGSLIALLVVSALVLAIFLVLLARAAQQEKN